MLRASARALSASRILAAGRFAASADKRTMCSAPQSVTVTFIDQDGDEIVCTGAEGTDLLQLAWDNDIEVEGACEKTLSCSTCHMYIPDELMMEVLSLCSSTTAEYWQRCSIVFARTPCWHACLSLSSWHSHVAFRSLTRSMGCSSPNPRRTSWTCWIWQTTCRTSESSLNDGAC